MSERPPTPTVSPDQLNLLINENNVKFDHSQSLISWIRHDRLPGLKEYRKTHELGRFTAAAAIGAEYITKKDFTSKYNGLVMDSPDDNDDNSVKKFDKNEDYIGKLGAELMEPRRQAAERAGRTGSVQLRSLEANSPQVITSRIEAINKQFKDPTYVPTLAEYREMQELAHHIYPSHHVGPDQPKRGMQYSVVGAGEQAINAHTARSFQDAVRAERWKLSDESQKDVETLLSGKPSAITSARQQMYHPRQETRSDYLNKDEYWRLHPQANQSVADRLKYDEYLRRRLDLDGMIKESEAGPRPVGEEEAASIRRRSGGMLRAIANRAKARRKR